MPYDLIEGQGQGHETFKVEVIYLPHLQC